MIYFIGEWVSLHPVLAGAAMAVSVDKCYWE